ncbi:MAG: DUF131 domain-containing protein [Methanolobus sp.]
MIGTLLVISGMLMIMAGLSLYFLQITMLHRSMGVKLGQLRILIPAHLLKQQMISHSQIKHRSKAVVIMLGPIPIIIGSDSSTTKTLVILAIVLWCCTSLYSCELWWSCDCVNLLFSVVRSIMRMHRGCEYVYTLLVQYRY